MFEKKDIEKFSIAKLFIIIIIFLFLYFFLYIIKMSSDINMVLIVVILCIITIYLVCYNGKSLSNNDVFTVSPIVDGTDLPVNFNPTFNINPWVDMFNKSDKIFTLNIYSEDVKNYRIPWNYTENNKRKNVNQYIPQRILKLPSAAVQHKTHPTINTKPESSLSHQTIYALTCNPIGLKYKVSLAKKTIIMLGSTSGYFPIDNYFEYPVQYKGLDVNNKPIIKAKNVKDRPNRFVDVPSNLVNFNTYGNFAVSDDRQGYMNMSLETLNLSVDKFNSLCEEYNKKLKTADLKGKYWIYSVDQYFRIAELYINQCYVDIINNRARMQSFDNYVYKLLYMQIESNKLNAYKVLTMIENFVNIMDNYLAIPVTRNYTGITIQRPNRTAVIADTINLQKIAPAQWEHVQRMLDINNNPNYSKIMFS